METHGLYSPAKAYWNQRTKLASSKEKILKLTQAVDSSVNLTPYQWIQLMAIALEFKPDLILELGRGYGNSTCAFTEVANLLKPDSCEVLSLCLSKGWRTRTVPRVSKIVDSSWFVPLKALETNILAYNFKPAIANNHKIFLFWDAHGFDVAEHILATVLPEIADKPHIVVVHDMSDARYCAKPVGNYKLWKGDNDEGRTIILGNIESGVEESISITDFTNRNNLVLHSADHSLRSELSDSQKSELSQLLGNDLFSLSCHWFWFSLNEGKAPFYYPIYTPPDSRRLYAQIRLLNLRERAGRLFGFRFK